MITLCKKLCKTALVGTLAIGALAGGTLLIAGPERGKAVFHDVRARIANVIDRNIDDPVALRNELRQLEKEYPKRIRKVREDLAGLEGDITQIERDRLISVRVVELADEDLAVLRPALEQAVANYGDGARARLAAVVVDDRVFTLQSASARVRQIENTRNAHARSAEEAQYQVAFLRQQGSQFAEVLGQLEAEQAEFTTQLEALNRQVDSIQRNERLISLLEKRKRTLEECASYDVESLDQLTGKLDEILNRQAAELNVLTAAEDAADYEDMAREELARERNVRATIDALDGSR
ncbi:MAG: hypothetical protein O2816_15605 [Planctomycetota bacterium]|nr:hypothetical protein [Planctomycetota bacterium]